MPEDRDYIRRAAATLDDVMSKPFVPTHGVSPGATSQKKPSRPPVKVETKRKRPAKADVIDKGT